MNPAVAWSYPLILLAAVAAGWLLLRQSQSQLGLSKQHKAALGLAAFCGAMLGAKLPFALTDLEGLRTGTVWFSNGKTILCGIVGAYAAVEVAKWIFVIRVKTGDSFAVPTAVAVGIGRISCFVAGCCHGTPTTLPWGVRFTLADGGAVPRHPTQLYESVFHLSMAAIMFMLQRHRVWPGQLVKFYIIVYLVYRFLSEFIRPEPRMVWGLSAYQWFALICIPIFAGLWRYDAASRERSQLLTSVADGSRAAVNEVGA